MHPDTWGTTATMQCANSAGDFFASWPSSLSAPARACHLRPCSLPVSSAPTAALVAWGLRDAMRAVPAACAASRTALTCRGGRSENEGVWRTVHTVLCVQSCACFVVLNVMFSFS